MTKKAAPGTNPQRGLIIYDSILNRYRQEMVILKP